MIASLAILSGCGHNGGTGHNHDHETHEVHEHSHDHDGHGHEGHDHDSHGHDAHGKEAHNHGKDVIEFSQARAEAAGLKTETVKPGKFNAAIRTSGEILPAQGTERTIVATTSGVISLGGKTGRLLPGIKVGKGASVAEISAREMAEGDPIMKSRAAYESAQKEFERAEGLLKVNAISQKAYEQAKKEYETAKAEYDAYNGKTGEKGLQVIAPMNGYITQVLVNEGDYVTAGQPVAVVSQNGRLQLRADLQEKYWSSAKSFTGANFKPSYSDVTYSIKDLGGRLVSVGNAVAQGSFYLPVIFEFNNAGNFIPGAFCEIYLIENQRENVISVPETSLTEEQGVYFVYLKVCKEEYRKQEVKIGESDGLRREILKGLKEGDVVVTEGAYQVKLATATGAIPGHSHNH